MTFICFPVRRYNTSTSRFPYSFYHVEGVPSVQFGRSVMSNSLQPHGLHHARIPCPSPTPGACSNSYRLSWWCHQTISSSVILFSSCLWSFPASGSFPMSQFFTSGGQSIEASALALVLPVNIQNWFPLGLTGLIALLSSDLIKDWNPKAYLNSCPLSRWCHQTISSSVVPFCSRLQSFPESGSFPMSRFFPSGGQSIGVSASVWVLPIIIQDWFPLGWTGWISLQSKGLSRVFSNTTVQKQQFFGAQLSL